MLIVKELNTAALKFRAGHTHYYEARPGEVAHLEDDAETLSTLTIGLAQLSVLYRRLKDEDTGNGTLDTTMFPTMESLLVDYGARGPCPFTHGCAVGAPSTSAMHASFRSYVEEMAGIHAPGVFVGGTLCTDFDCVCAQKDAGECSKQEVSYVAKFKNAPTADIQSRLKLLSASLAKSGKADEWMKQRITILKLLASQRAVEEAPATKQEL